MNTESLVYFYKNFVIQYSLIAVLYSTFLVSTSFHQVLLHLFKPTHNFLYKLLILGDFMHFCFTTYIKFTDLKGLFEVVILKFENIFLVPRKKRNRAVRMGNIGYYSHFFALY